MRDTLRRDVVYALRGLRRAPVFTLIVVLTLGAGLGAATAVFSVVNGVLLRPLPYREPERLVMIWNDFGQGAQSLPATSATDYLDYERETTLFEGFAAGTGGSEVGATGVLTGDGASERVELTPISAKLLPLLGVKPMLGRTFTEDEEALQGPKVVDPDLRPLAPAVRRRPGDHRQDHPARRGLAHRRRCPPAGFPPLPPGGGLRHPRGRPLHAAPDRPGQPAPAEPHHAHGVRTDQAGCDPGAGAGRDESRGREVPRHLSRAQDVAGADQGRPAAPRRGEKRRADAADPALRRRASRADRLRQRGQPAARPRHGPRARARHPPGDGRRPRPDRAAAPDREPDPRGAGRGAGRGPHLHGARRPRAAGTGHAAPARRRAGGLDGRGLHGRCCASAPRSCSASRPRCTPWSRGAATCSGPAAASPTRAGAGESGTRSSGRRSRSRWCCSWAAASWCGASSRCSASAPASRPSGVLTFQVSLPFAAYPEGAKRKEFWEELERRLTRLPGVASAARTNQLPLTGSGALQPYAYDEETARNFESVTAEARWVSPELLHGAGHAAARGPSVHARRQGVRGPTARSSSTTAWPGASGAARARSGNRSSSSRPAHPT